MIHPLFIPHGGGPLPLLNDPRHSNLIAFLSELPTQISIRPKAIVLISAHWEGNTFEITSNPNPGLLYDYGGFPDAAYQITYPVSGDVPLANRLQQMLSNANLPATLNPNRQFDHGVFVPLKLMYPNADIPVVQISLHRSLDPKIHIQLGTALQSLCAEDILILGSGFSYHNLRAFFSRDPRHDQANEAFHLWLKQVCTKMSRSDMLEHLKNWTMAPAARLCHPREEHLLPLLVCAGAGLNIGTSIFDQSVLGKHSLGLRF
jgi:aromatic ring-opening dioxygenase catalytic subunit (LigB family)